MPRTHRCWHEVTVLLVRLLGWLWASWHQRQRNNHPIVSVGVSEQCLGGSMICPELMKLWLGWTTLPDQRTIIFGVVAMITLCYVKDGL